MSVCLVNLVPLNLELQGDPNQIAREFSNTLLALQREQPAFFPVFAVQQRFVRQFAGWVDGDPTIIPVDPRQPSRPLLRGLNPDLLISPLSQINPFDEIDEFRQTPHIVVIFDTLSLDMPDLFTPDVRAQRQRTYDFARAAYRIVTLSAFCRDRLIEHLRVEPDVIAVIPPGTRTSRDETEPSLSTVVIGETWPPRPYLFYRAEPGSYNRYDLTLAVFGEVLRRRPDMHLVLAGVEADTSAGITASAIPADHVHPLDYVPESALTTLYANAEALLVTSTAIVIGTSVLEALRLGCPVICPPQASLPEIAGDAALYVDSDDPGEWAKTILDDLPEQRTALIERGLRRAASFTWKHARERFRNLLVESAPQVVGPDAAPTTPAVSLAMALREIEPMVEPISAVPNTFNGFQESVDVDTHMEYMRWLLWQEAHTPLARIPILGLVVRALIRVRNFGRFWRSSQLVAGEIMRRQLLLSARIKTAPPDRRQSDSRQ